MQSLEAAKHLRARIEGQQNLQASEGTHLACPDGAVMTARIEESPHETREAGFPYTLVVDCKEAP